MKIQTGDIWTQYDSADLFLLNTPGTAEPGVYHKGLEKAIARWPALPDAFANALKTRRKSKSGFWTYGFLMSQQWPTNKLGFIQIGWKPDELSLELVEMSYDKLAEWAWLNQSAQIHMELPALLTERSNTAYISLYEAAKRLPDNVHMWTALPWYRRPHWDLLPDLDAEDIAGIESMCAPLDPDMWFYGVWGVYRKQTQPPELINNNESA